MWNVCENVSPRQSGLFCWNHSACSLFPATTTQLFSQSLSFHTLCSSLENLSTTDNLCNFWPSKFQQVNTNAFCSWYDIFTQEWNCFSPKNLCKYTKTAPTLSTITSVEWNLCLPWGSYLATTFKLEMNVGDISKHQNKLSDTDRKKRCFFTARVSQVKVNTTKRIFPERS